MKNETGKMVITIILIIVGLACAMTGILIPVTYCCGHLINQMWKEKQ